MEPMLALRIAILSTRLHHTTAHPARSCSVIFPNNIALRSRTPAQLAAMDIKPSHMPAFTIIPGTSPAPVFIKLIITKKWATPLIWTWHGALIPSTLPVPLADMNTGIKMLLCPTTDHRGLYLQIQGSPLPQLSGTFHIIAPVVSHNKW